MRLMSNFSPFKTMFPLHIFVCVPWRIFNAAWLIQLHGKRHGLDFFLCVQGGHKEQR